MSRCMCEDCNFVRATSRRLVINYNTNIDFVWLLNGMALKVRMV